MHNSDVDRRKDRYFYILCSITTVCVCLNITYSNLVAQYDRVADLL
jgi:hypothetical protein